jgi:multimeric flavodoxin WrbA
MKITVVLSSNRKEQGFSAKVLNSIETICTGIATIDPIWLTDHQLEMCDADNLCSSSDCLIDDDFHKLVPRILSADAVIYVPVVHAYGTCSRMQSFIERLGYGFMRPRGRPMKDKLAMVVVVGRRYSHESVYSQMVLNLLLNRCILVGSGFPANFRSEMGTPERDVEALNSMRDGIHRMFDLYQSLNEKHIIKDREIKLCAI